MKYIIETSRHDVRPEIFTSFEVDTDEEAKIEFEKCKSNPCLAWDDMVLRRVDREAISAQMTTIAVK